MQKHAPLVPLRALTTGTTIISRSNIFRVTGEWGTPRNLISEPLLLEQKAAMPILAWS